MKKALVFLVIPLVLISLSGITGCRQKSQKEKVEIGLVDTLSGQIEEYPIPTSAQVIKMLSELDVAYQFGITNPVENASRYISSTARAINMGVFGADLSYCTVYNISQEVLNYLDGIRVLANELNMSKIYDVSLYDKLKANSDSKDLLVDILTEAFKTTYNYLAENEQQNLALLVVGGAWVEGMYLTCHVSEQAYNVAGISRNLIEQKKSFDTFEEITASYKTDPGIADFLAKLEPIRKVYAGLTTSLTTQDIINITKAIEEIRAQIIQ